VRTNYLDSSYGFINSPALFLFPEKLIHTPIEVEFEVNKYFRNIYCPLKKINNIFHADDYDELFDSPFFLSNRESFQFTSYNCRHEVIVEGNVSEKIKSNLVRDLKVITDYQSEIFDGNPNEYYLFIINMTEDNYGGLEHRACSVNVFDHSSLNDSTEYNRLLGLLAHEYFHLWNVKRIRPKALGPFNYLAPNLTRELWIAEGITSFYDNFILLKTGFYFKSEYMSEVLKDINRLEDSFGEDRMSLEESSFTAWIKYYKQNANSHNTGISYYVKGAILTLCIDLRIRQLSDSKKTFNDVMRYLYKRYAVKKNRGFTKSEFFTAITSATGFDLIHEFEPFISQKIRIPISKYLELIGIKLSKTAKKSCLPFEVKTNSGKEIISKIFEKYMPDIDIQVGDEIIAINGIRITKNKIDSIQSEIPEDSEITLLISRREIILERKMICKFNFSYRIQSPISNNDYEELFKTNILAKEFFQQIGAQT
jgi:predicted metalloprotease with PDZ domain